MIEQRLETDWPDLPTEGDSVCGEVEEWQRDTVWIYKPPILHRSIPIMECIVSLSAINMAVDRMWASGWLCRIQMRFKIQRRKYLILFARMLICFHRDYLDDSMYDWSRCDQLKRWGRSEVKEQCLKDEGGMSAGGRWGSFLLQADAIGNLG